MTVQELIQQLSQLNPDLTVMFQDPNANGGPFSVTRLQVHTAAEDEYPEDWNMPEGFTFVLLES